MSKQRGSLLLELAIVLAFLTLISVGSIHWLTQRAEKARTEAIAVWMQDARQGLQTFLTTHAAALLQSSPFVFPGIQNLGQPTLLELKKLGFLPPAFPDGDQLKIVLYKAQGCSEASCYLHGLVYNAQPFQTKKQRMDSDAMAYWQSVQKGEGLVVTDQNPHYFSGARLKVAHHELAAGLTFPPGTVALLASTDTSLLSNETWPVDKNPLFETDVNIDGGLTVRDDARIGRYLVLPHTETLGAACPNIGAIARGKDGKGLMSCENGQWIRPVVSMMSTDLYRQMIQTYWRITIPDSPGGFYAVQSVYNSYYCWLPNPLNLYYDGRGRCDCTSAYKKHELPGSTASEVKDMYFDNAIARPALRVFVCV